MIEYKGEWYCVYHGRNWGTNVAGSDKRTARIAKIAVDGLKLTAIRKKDEI